MSTYVKVIESSTSGADEIVTDSNGTDHGLVTQSSPSWVLTFVRWDIRDPVRTHTKSPLNTRQQIVVENDCIQCSVGVNKGSLTPAMSATLLVTDINYETAIHPGDFVLVNMLNWPSDARRIVNNAAAGFPINNPNDGFKGIFKVQSVRKSLMVDPQSGTKRMMVKIDGFAFTEFNNTIYFNPNLINQKNLENQALFISDISTAWANYVSKVGKPFVQEVIAFLIQNLIGKADNPKAKTVKGLIISPNYHFLIPNLVGKLLGVRNSAKLNDHRTSISAKDLFVYMFGIQKYASGSSADLKVGMNPSNLQSRERYPAFFYTKEFCQGNTLLKPDYWNQVKVWSILNQYTNSPLNELFTCFRISPYGQVLPTVVFRQIPFTSEDFEKQKFNNKKPASNISVTKFLSLPRWKIDASQVFSLDIGLDEAARINFVQFYGKSNFNDKGVEISGETASGNYVFDKDDIQRSGLRPYIVQNQFDDLPDPLIRSAVVWARILGDAVIGGHLKLNGTIECIGIVDPIAVGDNLEFDGVVYHIEQIAHSCSLSGEGIKTFRTTISLSHGVSINSTTSGMKYAEMTDTNAYKLRTDDYSKSQILPGVSESQSTQNREDKNNIDLVPTKNLPFRQPNKNGRGNTGE